jgi:DNA-binding YbaB/EbfC family protein
MLKQAQQVQARMQEMQERLSGIEIVGQSGGGMVSVTLSGKGDLRKVMIDPSLLKPEDAEVVEDLIVAAHADARQKLEARVAEEMAKVTGGLNLPPGMSLPF